MNMLAGSPLRLLKIAGRLELCGFEPLGDTRRLQGGAASDAPAAPLAVGSVLGGRFRVDAVLAVGSMGTVYAAVDLREMAAPRALKELLEFWGTAEERVEAEAWFRREGETLRGLDHPAIPRVYETLSTGRRHYLVMELVEGETVEKVLAAHGGAGLAEEQVLGWADQVLDVLSYLHSRPDPVIFRDIKPANLMLTPLGEIRLIDFGIARVFSRQSKGTAIGTPGFAAPEQYQGLAEPASDLYALGATMHHLLTARDPRQARLFDFPPARTLAPWLSPHVAAAVDRALVLDPRRRFDTASDMYRALHATTSLANLPRLSQGNSRATLPAGALVPLLSDARVEVTIGLVGEPAPANAASLAPDAGQITHGGITLLAPRDRGRLELHNHTNERLSCTFASAVPWLKVRQPAAWLDPHGMLEVMVDAAPSDPIDTRGQALIARDAAHLPQRPSPLVYLRVDGATANRRVPGLTILPGLAPLSIVAVSSIVAVLIVIMAHLSILGFYVMEIPALALAVRIQWRRGRRP